MAEAFPESSTLQVIDMVVAMNQLVTPEVANNIIEAAHKAAKERRDVKAAHDHGLRLVDRDWG